MNLMLLLFLAVSTAVFAVLEHYLRTFFAPDSITETIQLKRKQAMASLVDGGVRHEEIVSIAAEVHRLERKLWWATHLPYSLPATLWAISNFTFMYYYL